MKPKRLLLAAAVALAVWTALGYGVAEFIVRPRNSDIGDRKEIAGTPTEDVSITTGDGVRLSAWLSRGKPDRAVVLAAGIDANRGALVGRGEFYLSKGFTVLLPDLRGTGESDATPVSIGWEERKDILACVQFLRDRGYEHVGVNGISLGASAIAYSMQDDPNYDFVVLESCYDTLDNAWRNRLAMFNVPHAITLPVRWFVEAKLGTKANLLAPMRYMEQCHAPTLILAGDSEPELKVSETDSLFQRCAAEDKRLYLFQGGRHQDFLSSFEIEFRTVVGGFLDEVSAKWQASGLSA